MGGLGTTWKDNIEIDLTKHAMGMWTGFTWLRSGSNEYGVAVIWTEQCRGIFCNLVADSPASIWDIPNQDQAHQSYIFQ